MNQWDRFRLTWFLFWFFDERKGNLIWFFTESWEKENKKGKKKNQSRLWLKKETWYWYLHVKIMVAVVVNVYEGERMLGEVELYTDHLNGVVWEREIRISHYSPSSERCPPLAVLHTISSSSPSSILTGLCFKLELKDESQPQNSLLYLLHSTCLRENKVLHNCQLQLPPNSQNSICSLRTQTKKTEKMKLYFLENSNNYDTPSSYKK